jgi:hypothetical protein
MPAKQESATQEARLQSKSAETLLQTLAGVVCPQWKKCGKPGCRCSRGQLHAYFARFWRENGRLRKAYVRKDNVEDVRRRCLARRRARAEWQAATQELREMAAFLKGLEKP